MPIEIVVLLSQSLLQLKRHRHAFPDSEGRGGPGSRGKTLEIATRKKVHVPYQNFQNIKHPKTIRKLQKRNIVNTKSSEGVKIN